MKELRFGISAAVVLVALAAGCKKADVSQSSAMSAAKEGRPSERPLVEAVPVPPESRDFIVKAAQGNLLEIALGRLALARGASPAVREFGMRLVADHSQAYGELRQLAAKRGVHLPSEPSPSDKMMIQSMAGLVGRAFDRAFADHMVQDHERAIADFRRASRELRDPELREWAAKMVPVLESHLAQAKQVKAAVDR